MGGWGKHLLKVPYPSFFDRLNLSLIFKVSFIFEWVCVLSIGYAKEDLLLD